MREFSDIDLQSVIAGVRADCVSAFAGLGERLGDVRQGLDGVGAQVAGLGDLLGALGAGAEAGDSITAACQDLCAALEDTHVALARTDVTHAIRTAIEALGSIERQAKHLTAVSSITCVTARSTGAESLGDYVVSLRQMTDDLARAVRGLHQGLGAIHHAHASVLGSIDASARCVRAAMERIERLAATARPAESDRGALQERFETGASTLAEATRRETAALITAMQFSDSLAQRLEHVEEIIAGTTGRERAGRALAAAQITALAEDATATLNDLSAVLARLSDAGASAAEAVSARDGLQVEALLHTRRADLAEGTALQALVVPSLSEAQAGADRIQQQIDQARQGYKRLMETAVGVNLSAINATLLTARGGAARAAMAVLSESVRGSARDCADHTGQCRAAMEVLESAVKDARFPMVSAAGQTLRAAIGGCATALDAAEGDLARLASMRDMAGTSAAALIGAIGAGEASLARVAPAIDMLHEAARTLAASPPPSAAELAALTDMEPLYTMPCEREVHARLCGTPMAEPVAAKQDLCDIFF